MTWHFCPEKNTNTSNHYHTIQYTPSPLSLSNMQTKSKETRRGAKCGTHTGSESLTQTCKAVLIKGPSWLWWFDAGFISHSLCTQHLCINNFKPLTEQKKQKKRVPVWLLPDPRWRKGLMEKCCWSIWTKSGERILHSTRCVLFQRRCVCVFLSPGLTDTCTDAFSPSPNCYQRANVVPLQHVSIAYCWSVVFISVKHMQEC